VNPYNPQIRPAAITQSDATYLRSSLTGYPGRPEQTQPDAPALTVRRGLSWYCSFSAFAVPYNVVQAKHRFNLSYKNLIKVGIIPVLGPKIGQFWVSRRGRKLFPGPAIAPRRAWTISASPGHSPGQRAWWSRSTRLAGPPDKRATAWSPRCPQSPWLPLVALASSPRPSPSR
jgi:hypothetical protein